MPYASPSERAIPLEGMYNVRDLGGLPTAGGRLTRRGVLLRADSPHRLTPAGQQRLLDAGLRTVIDLRYDHDIVDEPDPFATCSTVAYVHYPLYVKVGGDGLYQSLEDLFCRVLDYHQESVAHVLRLLVAPGAPPALVHCTSGKDRTGVVVALALAAAGVTDAAIIEDFAVSAGNLLPDRPIHVERLIGRGFTPERIEWFVDSPPEAMTGMLRHLRQRYDGPASYLTGIGFDAEAQAALQRLLVEG